MPLYEYKCNDCGEIVSELRRVSEREEPLTCPHCSGVAEVILSSFSTPRGDSKPECWSSDAACGPT